MSSERSSHSDSSAVGVVSSRTSTAGSVATVRVVGKSNAMHGGSQYSAGRMAGGG